MLYLVMLIATFFFIVHYVREKAKNLPPGPPRIPVIGSLISVLLTDSKSPADAFRKLSEKYGPIFTLQMGSVLTVCINGHETLSRIAYSEDLLSHVDEKDIWVLEKTASLPLGLVFSLPNFWRETRAFTNKLLRRHGLNTKSKTGGIIVAEALDFCNEWKEMMTDGQLQLTISNQFNKIFFNVVLTLTCGKKFSNDDPKTQQLLEAVENYVKSGKFGGGIGSIYPELVKLFPKATGFTALQSVCKVWRKMLQVTMDEHRKESRIQDGEVENFMDELLKTVDGYEKPKNVLDSIYTEENSLAIFQDIVLGGTETQSHVMQFFVRYMVQYPDIQAKLQVMVDKVVTKDRPVDIEDMPSLVYLQAVIQEVIRHSSLVPIMPRKLLKPWKIDNYEIPKGTLIIMNIMSADHDEWFWKDAEKFDPDRFISADGKFVNAEKVYAFGFGKRRCIGEQMAKTAMALVAATLIQQFSFGMDPKIGMPSDDFTTQFTRDAIPFPIILRSRCPTLLESSKFLIQISK